LGDQWNEETELAWKAVYSALSRTMIEAAKTVDQTNAAIF
jgi:hypothetical protein